MPEPTQISAAELAKECSEEVIRREYDAAADQVNAHFPTSARIRPFADCLPHARRPVFLFARRMYELGRASAAASELARQAARRYSAITTRGLHLDPPQPDDPADRQWEVMDPCTGGQWYGATLDEALDKAIKAEAPDA